MMPPSKVVPFGAPYRPFGVLTVFLKSLVRSLTQGWSVSGCSVWSGCRAWNRDPVLYRNTSSMVPVDKRVLTRLSPSVPPGRVSTLTVIVGFALWKAAARSFANFVAAGSFPPAINEMVVGPLELFALDEQAASAAPRRATQPSAATTGDVVRLENIKYLLVMCRPRAAIRARAESLHLKLGSCVALVNRQTVTIQTRRGTRVRPKS